MVRRHRESGEARRRCRFCLKCCNLAPLLSPLLHTATTRHAASAVHHRAHGGRRAGGRRRDVPGVGAARVRAHAHAPRARHHVPLHRPLARLARGAGAAARGRAAAARRLCLPRRGVRRAGTAARHLPARPAGAARALGARRRPARGAPGTRAGQLCRCWCCRCWCCRCECFLYCKCFHYCRTGRVCSRRALHALSLRRHPRRRPAARPHRGAAPARPAAPPSRRHADDHRHGARRDECRGGARPGTGAGGHGAARPQRSLRVGRCAGTALWARRECEWSRWGMEGHPRRQPERRVAAARRQRRRRRGTRCLPGRMSLHAHAASIRGSSEGDAAPAAHSTMLSSPPDWGASASPVCVS